jgi:hypothetical protein
MPLSSEDLKNLLAIDAKRAPESQAKRTPESQAKRRASRPFVRYLVAICVGIAGTLAWQSYGEATKQIIATRAPELGWSPEAKQMITNWVQQLGWTKPPATLPQVETVAQTAPATIAPKAPTAPSLDPAQVQQMVQNLAALRQTVEQLAAGQDQIAREIKQVLAADMELLSKMPAPPPQPPAAPARKPMLAPPPTSSRAPSTAPHP